MKIQIRPAHISEASSLTAISFEAKRHWNYPEEYYEHWRDELTINEDYIRSNMVHVAVYGDLLIGFYAIVENPQDFWAGKVFVAKGFWLEHIFIKPEFHKLGIGRQLIKHACIAAKDKGINKLMIFVDPFAKGFYDKVGARYVKDSPSSIDGRMIPIYELYPN